MAGIPRLLNDAYGYDVGGLVICPCSWGVNGASNPDSSSILGDILSSVTYDSGVYTATIKDVGYSILAAVPTLQLTGDAVDLYPLIGDIDTSALTVKVKLKTGSSNTQPPAANANSRCGFVLFLQKGSASRHRS